MDEAAALALVERALEPGEALLWFEAAPSAPLKSLAVFGTIVLAVLMAAFLALTWKALRRGGPAPRALVGLTLALLMVGEVLAVQRIFAADSTVYGVTDRRVLMVSRDPVFDVQSFPPERIQNLRREGDRLHFSFTRGRRRNAATLWELSDAEGVEALIRERVLGE